MNIDKIGIIGAGAFGISVANLVSQNKEVYVFSRRDEAVEQINKTRTLGELKINDGIEATRDIQKICDECVLIMPIIPSSQFRDTIRLFAPYLTPKNILIHGTKGLDIKDLKEYGKNDSLDRDHLFTMGEVIKQETSVVRVGCMAGPNLAKEIMDDKPTATVIASSFDEVIKLGSEALKGKNLYIFSSNEMRGTEIVGAFKNIFAIAAGIIHGHDLGKNIFGVLITRAMREMFNYLKLLGINTKPALGTAGIGDLVTTAGSVDSRNFKFGVQIAEGKTIQDILAESSELAEGVRTLKAAYLLSNRYKIDVPITSLLYQVVYENLDFERAISFMMSYPFQEDVDFL